MSEDDPARGKKDIEFFDGGEFYAPTLGGTLLNDLLMTDSR